jgi:ankyrin repeat protein
MKVDPTGQNREVDPSVSNNHPIRLASLKGYDEIVRLLLKDTRVNPSDVNNAALLNAVKANNTEIVRMLLEYCKLLF